MNWKTWCVVLVVVVVASSAPVMAQDMVTVRITNVSQQIISPPLVATHTWKAQIFVPGMPASTELSLLAEDGDPSNLAAALEDSDEVLDVAVAGGLLFPGETMTFELESRGKYNRVSAVGMLVTTNDAFFGLQNFRIQPGSMNQRISVPAWDAGTEANNELCDVIPGPPCGNPFVRATEGAEGYVYVHPGLHGEGDLSPADWDWRNPVVEILVVKR